MIKTNRGGNNATLVRRELIPQETTKYKSTICKPDWYLVADYLSQTDLHSHLAIRYKNANVDKAQKGFLISQMTIQYLMLQDAASRYFVKVDQNEIGEDGKYYPGGRNPDAKVGRNLASALMTATQKEIRSIHTDLNMAPPEIISSPNDPALDALFAFKH